MDKNVEPISLGSVYESGIDLLEFYKFEMNDDPRAYFDDTYPAASRKEHFDWLNSVFDVLKSEEITHLEAARLKRKLNFISDYSDYIIEEQSINLTLEKILQDTETILQTLDTISEYVGITLTVNIRNKKKRLHAVYHSITPENLSPESYNKEKGTITLRPGLKVAISLSNKAKRPNGTKYNQCWLLERIFRNVNTIRLGVSFSQITGLSRANITKNHIKKIRNDVNEINSKISLVGGPKDLIKVQRERVFINNSYL